MGLGQKTGVRVCYPRMELCTDNGAMIAYAGYCRMANAQLPSAFSAKAALVVERVGAGLEPDDFEAQKTRS